MTCASESMETSSAGRVGSPGSIGQPSSATEHPLGMVSASRDASTQGEFSCGCSSCHAVTLASWVVPKLAMSAPTPVAQAPAALLSVVRTPLLPPPERTAL
jgi:hypothetical protein